MKQEKNQSNKRRTKTMYTPDGELIVIEHPDGKLDIAELEEKPYLKMHPELREHEERAMLFLAKGVNEIKKIKRKLPLLRSELMMYGVRKGTLAKLISYGLVKKSTIAVTDTNSGDNVGNRVVVYFTPQGHGCIKEVIKKHEHKSTHEEEPDRGSDSREGMERGSDKADSSSERPDSGEQRRCCDIKPRGSESE